MKILNIRIELQNPFDRWDYFTNFGCVKGMLTKYTAWELEHSYYSPMLFDCELRLSTREDHAGFEFGIGIFGYGIHFLIYDTRHWNTETKQWEERDFSEYFEIKA
jgi:hypothetical protein